jgi:hypothetical protein
MLSRWHWRKQIIYMGSNQGNKARTCNDNGNRGIKNSKWMVVRETHNFGWIIIDFSGNERTLLKKILVCLVLSLINIAPLLFIGCRAARCCEFKRTGAGDWVRFAPSLVSPRQNGTSTDCASLLCWWRCLRGAMCIYWRDSSFLSEEFYSL